MVQFHLFPQKICLLNFLLIVLQCSLPLVWNLQRFQILNPNQYLILKCHFTYNIFLIIDLTMLGVKDYVKQIIIFHFLCMVLLLMFLMLGVFLYANNSVMVARQIVDLLDKVRLLLLDIGSYAIWISTRL